MANGKLQDGTYLRQHIHGDDAIAPQLRGYLPEHDERYIGLVVRGGKVVETVKRKPLTERVKPVYYRPAVEVPQEEGPVEVVREVDDSEIVAPVEEQAPAPTVELHLLKKAELEALAKDRGLSALGTRAELIGRIRAADKAAEAQ